VRRAAPGRSTSRHLGIRGLDGHNRLPNPSTFKFTSQSRKMKASLLLLGLPALGLAYPGMMGDMSREEALQMLREKRDAELVAESQPEKRQILSGLVGSVSQLVSDVGGLLGSVASSVDPANKRPEPGYTYKDPVSGDSRGPCPGLNLLANYGYLPRNGHVTFSEVLDATA